MQQTMSVFIKFVALKRQTKKDKMVTSDGHRLSSNTINQVKRM